MNTQTRLSRQASMISDPSAYKLLFIGVGGIGSNALHVAISTGFEDITLVDPDVVGEENIYPGFFEIGDVGFPKAEALSGVVEAMYDLDTIKSISSKIEDASGLGQYDIVIISTDSTTSRRMAWSILAEEICSGYWIDGSMGGMLGTVKTVDMANELTKEHYVSHLNSQVAEPLPCGEKATAPMTKGWIAGMIGQSLVDIVNEKEPNYYQRYDMESATFIIVPQIKGETDNDTDNINIE